VLLLTRRISKNDAEERFSTNLDVDVILLAFLLQMDGLGGEPVLNFANQGDDKKCQRFPGTYLANCPELEYVIFPSCYPKVPCLPYLPECALKAARADIQACQIAHGKTILLSIGSATYNEGGFPTPDAAITSARKIWSMFGPPQSSSLFAGLYLDGYHPTMNQASALRPFGQASVDGFDFDIEASAQNMASFANELRTLMNDYTKHSGNQQGRPFYLTAAPQCGFPDLYMKDVIDNVYLDMVFVQFYNNWCRINSFVPSTNEQPAYSFKAWDTWAREQSKNKDVKVFVGVPGGQSAAGSGYLPVDALAPVIEYSAKFDSLSGTMVWDASQAWANDGFLQGVKSALVRVSKRKGMSGEE
jgi:chitinase